jgi:hypothetical protein
MITLNRILSSGMQGHRDYKLQLAPLHIREDAILSITGDCKTPEYDYNVDSFKAVKSATQLVVEGGIRMYVTESADDILAKVG